MSVKQDYQLMARQATELAAYKLALHQLVGALTNAQAWVRLAEETPGLMAPEVVENLRATLFGHTSEAMDPIAFHRASQERKHKDEENLR
jgi:hypothetical protein